ncbi:DNA methyltransferase [Elizabethkingia anophelis]|uniref:DNA methyltransferase n=1 Tax=Elizabethkingia anophelis TaxID=1117645 RepID=UPI000977DDAC|nr:DNA methyltransferase [Elizabethkingia anophelis]
MKNYNKAPLPFQGQKRNFVKKFKEALQDFPADAIYVDLFGGSGLLSHTVKSVHPNAKVIYNDFDNYSERLKNIDKTNAVIKDIKSLVKGLPLKKKIDAPIRQQIIDRIKQESGFVDYITISSSILFSGNYANSIADLEKQTFYSRVPVVDYSAEEYLQGVEIVSIDYKELFELYKDCNNVVFLLDPPYLSTDVKTYTDDKYWSLIHYLDVLKTIEGKSFFYFTSNKSQIIELLNWLHTNNYGYSPFADAITVSTKNTVNYSSAYEDIMIHKKIA